MKTQPPKHILTTEGLLEWLHSQETIYASSYSTTVKKSLTSNCFGRLTVFQNGEVKYSGTSITDAIEIYNEIV